MDRQGYIELGARATKAARMVGDALMDIYEWESEVGEDLDIELDDSLLWKDQDKVYFEQTQDRLHRIAGHCAATVVGMPRPDTFESLRVLYDQETMADLPEDFGCSHCGG